MNEWILRDEHSGKERHFDSRSEAEEAKDEMAGLMEGPLTVEKATTTDGGTEPEVVEADATDAEVVEPESTDPEALSEDPIGFLRRVNNDFVNTIQGKPAISKQGFRFIQREFEISTESEVVQWVDDPLGCVVWAKAELDSGYSAEAHGEGYQFESGVSNNEFVRYADTRAKNRAISDLTSAGALAVSELTEEP